MRKFYYILLISLIIQTGHAQQLCISFESGLGTYNMSDLKSFMYNSQNGNTLSPHLVSNFPPYAYFQPSLCLNSSSFNIGICTTLQSTGSRYSIQDYSGKYYFDSKIHSLSPGVFLDILLSERKDAQIFFRNKTGILFSRLALNEYLSIYGQTAIDQSVEAIATNYYYEPSLRYNRKIAGHLRLEGSLGYCIQTNGGGFYQKEDVDAKLYNFNGKQLKPQWDGLRLGLTALIVL